jgi:hypothetical protein
MSVTLFGTCRIDRIKNNNNLNNRINYTHSTKEVLQQIRFLRGERQFPSPFDNLCFRTGIVNNVPITYDSEFNELFNNSTVCVIEICSDKKYIYDDFYLHHLCVDKRFADYNLNTPQEILDNFKCVKQTYTEIENDILEIIELLGKKKVILVTHYNSKINEKYIESRNNLITSLADICEKHNITMINPTEVLKEYSQEQVITEDLGHYTEFGITKFTEYMNNFLETQTFKTNP